MIVAITDMLRAVLLTLPEFRTSYSTCLDCFVAFVSAVKQNTAFKVDRDEVRSTTLL